MIETANRWREKLLEARGTRFVFPSDEFYLQAKMEIPADEEYEDYASIDDGVGLLRLLHTEFTDAWNELPDSEISAPQSGHLQSVTWVSVKKDSQGVQYQPS